MSPTRSAQQTHQHHHPPHHQQQQRLNGAGPSSVSSSISPQRPQVTFSVTTDTLSQQGSPTSSSIQGFPSVENAEDASPAFVQQKTFGDQHSDLTSGFHQPVPSSAPQSFPDLFADDYTSSDHPEKRRNSLTLPKIDSVANQQNASATVPDPSSSRNSSPYASPILPPRARQGGIGSMGEITLPPLDSAVPMRRGAVSGASSGPSLPFPPIKLLQNEEDIPSRGPSPTLGKRPSFSLGHSNHVPPGPDIHLPPPSLSGLTERRPTIPANGTNPTAALASLQTPSTYNNGQHSHPSGQSADGADYSRSGAVRMSDDGAGYYYTNSATHPGGAPRSVGTSNWANAGAYAGMKRPEASIDEAPQPMGGFNNYQHLGANAPRTSHYAEESYYNHHSHASLAGGHPGMHDANRYSGVAGGPSPNIYGRYEQHDNPHSYGIVSRQMGYGLSMGPDDHLMSINGKRPRSAPRVLSSQPRIFACSQCPARFARNHDLKRHQRGHLSVRPYPCTWCGKSFSRKDALKRHVLVKGCGKDKKGGNGRGGGNNSNNHDGHVRKSGGGDEGHTDNSRSDAGGDRGDEYGGEGEDDEQSDAEENRSNHTVSGTFDSRQTTVPNRHLEYHNNYPASSSMNTYNQLSNDHSTLNNPYRWNKPTNIPSMATQAAASMRAGDFTGAATSLVGFAAARRPSASIA